MNNFNKRLFVGNLPENTSANFLKEYFSKQGPVVTVEIAKKRNTNINQNFAYIVMKTVEGAKKAVASLHNSQLKETRITVYEAKQEKE